MSLPPKRWSLIVAVKDDGVLRDTLLRSPDVNLDCELITKKGYASAGSAYNDGAAEATSDVLVFAHTDVYFPPGWLGRVRRALDTLRSEDPEWGVLGVCGRGLNGELVGHVHSTGLAATLGRPFESPIPALSLDEMVLITRRSAGLRFEPKLGFHLYGTDICYEARARGMKSYVVPAFCIHNSNGIRMLPWAFWRSYLAVRRKWWTELPIESCCASITRGCVPLMRAQAAGLRSIARGTTVGGRCADPAVLYSRLQASHDA